MSSDSAKLALEPHDCLGIKFLMFNPVRHYRKFSLVWLDMEMPQNNAYLCITIPGLLSHCCMTKGQSYLTFQHWCSRANGACTASYGGGSHRGLLKVRFVLLSGDCIAAPSVLKSWIGLGPKALNPERSYRGKNGMMQRAVGSVHKSTHQAVWNKVNML